MNSRQLADFTVSPSDSQPGTGDSLCKVAFVDISVTKATPRTSCRSAASSDTDESVTSSLSAMTSRSGDSVDELLPSSASAWSTYVYFYPRHDMTYTHCLLSTSRHVDSTVSSAACWPQLPGKDTIPDGGSGQETVPTVGADRGRRRVNATRTPFWFPVARSYDATAPAYFYYPRHDLSYAEVETSRLDRQPSVNQSSPPFDTILEELADDVSSLDDWSYVLEDRKSVEDVEYIQLACNVVYDEVRSVSSSMSACRSEEEQGACSLMLQICADDDVMALDDAAAGCASTSASVTDHETTGSSDRKISLCSPTVDAILTPITKLDLRSLEVATPRLQRVDSGRSRGRGKVRGGMRRCVSDPAVRSTGQQSPVRELPQSARVAWKRNQFSTVAAVDDDDGVEDENVGGDQALCSPRTVDVPLRPKFAVTCLLHSPVCQHPQMAIRVAGNRNQFSAAVDEDDVDDRGPVSQRSDEKHPHTSENDVITGCDVTGNSELLNCDVAVRAKCAVACPLLGQKQSDILNSADRKSALDPAVSNEHDVSPREFPTSTASILASPTAVAAVKDQRHTDISDRTIIDRRTEMASSDNMVAMDWSSSSSEYLTPPSRCLEIDRTAALSPAVTKFRDATSQTTSDHLYSPVPQTGQLGRPQEGSFVAASSTFTRICDAALPPSLHTDIRPSVEVQNIHPERNGSVTGRIAVTQIDNSVRPGDVHLSDVQEGELELSPVNNVVLSSPTRSRGTTSTTSENDEAMCRFSERHSKSATAAGICDTNIYQAGVQSTHPSSVEDVNAVAASRTITLDSKATPRTSHTVVPSTEVCDFPDLVRNKLVTASSRHTRICDVSAVQVRCTEVDSSRRRRIEQSKPDITDNSRWPAVIQVDRRRSSASIRSSDLAPRHSLDHRRPSTSTVRETRPAPPRRTQRPNVERIGPDSLLVVGGLTAYVAALTPRNQEATSRRDPVSSYRRTTPPSKSYVDIWRKRVATYEAFVNRCQTAPTGARCQHGSQHWR